MNNYPSYKADFDKVNGVYDTALNKDVNALKASYDQTVAEVEASKAKIPQTYQTAANQSAANYQREKAAFDEAAAANGINTGAGSQVKLSMLNKQQGAQTGINTQRANAATDAENQILKLKQEFQSAIAQANANNEYERSAALLKEYQNEAQSAVSTAQNQINMDYSQNLERAETLARFGDFSGYEALGYTPDQTAQMQNAWIAANFSLAKKMGLVSGSATSAPAPITIPAPETVTSGTVYSNPAQAIAAQMQSAISEGASVDEVLKAISGNKNIDMNTKQTALKIFNGG